MAIANKGPTPLGRLLAMASSKFNAGSSFLKRTSISGFQLSTLWLVLWVAVLCTGLSKFLILWLSKLGFRIQGYPKPYIFFSNLRIFEPGLKTKSINTLLKIEDCIGTKSFQQIKTKDCIGTEFLQLVKTSHLSIKFSLPNNFVKIQLTYEPT